MSSSGTAWTRCLFPLLDALGWKGDRAALLDNFGTINDVEDIHDFRNALAALHFDSRAGKIRLDRIDDRLLPCLFVSSEGNPICVIRRQENGFFVFDGTSGTFRNLEATSGWGTAVFYYPLNEDADSIFASRSDWLSLVSARFKKNIITALLFSFALGLISLLYPILIAALYGQMTIRGNENAVINLGLGVIVFICAEVGFRYLRSTILGYTSLRSGKILSEELFRRLLAFQASFTESASTEAQVRRVKDLRNIADFIAGQALSSIFDLPFVFIMLIWMVSAGGALALVPALALVGFGLASIVIYPIMKRIQGYASLARSRRMDVAAAIISGSEDIVSAGMQEAWLNKFDEASANSALAGYSESSAAIALSSFSSFFVSAGGLATLYVGVRGVLSGQMQSAALVASMMLVWRVLGIARSTFVILNQIDSLTGSVRQLKRFMALAQETRPVAFTVPQRLPEGALSFQDVSFRYGPEGYPALYTVSFSAEPGELTVLTGRQGAGKTTLLKLALAMYRPQAGRTMIGPFNIQQSDPSLLRRAIGYAGEKPLLIRGRLGDFISGSADASDELVRSVLDGLGFTEALAEANLTLDTSTDELSKGDRSDLERLAAISRACVRRASLYLFDEQVFHDAARYRNRFIAELKLLARSGVPVLAASNDPEIIAAADRVVRLDAGRVKAVEDRKKR